MSEEKGLARKVKRKLNSDFWKKDITFYLDGVSLTHKYYPCGQACASKTMAWRCHGEEFKFTCTSKKNEGTEGKVAHFSTMVNLMGKILQISFGNILLLFSPRVQIQKANSSCKIKAHLRIAKEQGMPKTGQTNFSISPRSPDINPIENIFHHVKCKLGNDTIEHKTFDELSKRVKMTLESYCIREIDRTSA